MRVSQLGEGETGVTISPESVTEIIDPTKPTRTRHHPRWCDHQQCITGEGAARHSSTTTRLITGEQIFALTLIQHDPHGATRSSSSRSLTPPTRTACTCSPCPRSRHSPRPC
jgi:hypothetical protein